MNMIIHDDGHTNVVAADGLQPIGDIAAKSGNRGFKDESFDCIITNPPFGSTIKQTEHAYLGLYGLAERGVDWLNPKSKAAQRPGVSSEILFIEQCWHFLVEGGYLAIVIPDGILTNASLQYVRDWMMEKFRVLAVVSLPQITFMSTGAGEKSSVLFLRKRPWSLSKKLREAKESLQREIAEKWGLADELTKIDKRRKSALEKLDKRPEFAALEKKARKENAEYKTAADEIAAEAEKATAELRDKLESEYRQRSKDIFPDEDIFMAIAEDIGFDATGKPTKVNELDEIGTALAKFIKTAAEERT